MQRIAGIASFQSAELSSYFFFCVCTCFLIFIFSLYQHICGALRDLVPFEQFQKPEKYPWRSVNFSKVAGLKPGALLKLTLFHGFFSRFLNCTNSTKFRNASHI